MAEKQVQTGQQNTGSTGPSHRNFIKGVRLSWSKHLYHELTIYYPAWNQLPTATSLSTSRMAT
jgi:hypothetical protein